jgi:type I restriction enzyme, S subunit
MNAAQLLAHFDRISDAPDAVSRLRQFILDLAVRGKLLSQDPHNDPVSELLTKIAAEKDRLVNAGAIRAPKPIPEVAEVPFPIPSNWKWSQLAEVGVLNPRNEAPDKLETSFVPMPLISADYGIPNKHEVRLWSDIKKGYTHFAEGDVGLAKITPCFENGKSAVFRNLTGRIGSGTTELHIVRPLYVHPDYILIFLKSPHFIETGIPKMTGTAGQKRVPAEYFAFTPFPLPPLAEQHRIVAKVDELMALCDQLEAARTERENQRNRLMASTLQRLNQPDPDPATFKAHATFALNNLAPLTTRPEQIKQIRQTILNLAVCGKLVRQEENDGLGAELLREISVVRSKLVKERKAPKPRELPLLDEMNLPFGLPKSWKWAMLGDLCYQVSDGPHFSPQYVAEHCGVPFLSTRNVRLGGFDLTSMKYISPEDHEEFCKRIRPEKGDIIYTKGGTTGIARVNDLDFEFSVWVHLAVLRIDKQRLEPRYIELALNSPHCYAQSQEYTQGISNFDLGLTRMIKITVPVPPLPEQRRIVAKVDELMALCDQLEANLSKGVDTTSRLLDALLYDALTPNARQLEAAE